MDWREQLEGKTIHLVFYCHADWQWEQSRLWHVERYVLSLRECLDWLDRTADLTLVLDNISEYLEPVWQRLNEAERERVRAMVRQGRIGIAPAGVANGRPTHLGDETFIRNLILGRRAFREYFPEADLDLFQSVDVSIGHSQMPQLLRLAGFTAYRAWRPEAALDADDTPRQFLWRGLDGSEIPVLRGPYGCFYLSESLPTTAPDWEEAATRFYEQMLAPQLESDRSPSGHLFLYVGCDDARPFRTHDGDRFYDLPAFLRQWRERETAPVVFDRPSDVRDAVLAERERLATVSGVLDGAEAGYNMAWGGRDGLWPWRTGNDLALVEAERYAALAHWHGAAYPEAEVAALWRDHLTYQAHAQETAFAEDFNELRELARHVRYEAERTGHRAREYLVAQLGGGDRFTRYVFNPHSWPVSETIAVHHSCVTPTSASVVAVDDDGRPLPAQIVRTLSHPRFGGALNDADLLVRVDVPAGTARRIRLVESAEALPEPEPPGDSLETAHLRLQYGGPALRSVTPVGSPMRFFSPDGGPWPTLTWHETAERNWYGPRLDRQRVAWEPTGGVWEETGPLRWRHHASGSLAHFQADVRTDAWVDAARLDVHVRLFDTSGGRAPAGFAALWLPLPADGRLTADIPFGIEPREPMRYRYMDRPGEGARGEGLFERPRLGQFWARSWVRWAGEGQALTLVSWDGGVHYLWEPGRLGHALGRFVNPDRDLWEARAWNEDRYHGYEHRFSYSLLFDDGSLSPADLIRFAAERRTPMRAEAPDRGGAGDMAALAGLAVDGPAVLSAAYVEGGRHIVRLYECTGTGGEVTVRLPAAPASVVATDFEGRPLALAVTLDGSLARLSLAPWQVVTLSVTP